MFGIFIKELRARKRLGLREFCLEHGHDPSNWSKIEREVLSPPRDEETLRKWAKQLGLKPGSDDWHKFHDYAAVDAGRIPDHVMENEELLAKLPAFLPHALRPKTLAGGFGKTAQNHQSRQPTLNNPGKFKAPFIPKRTNLAGDRKAACSPFGGSHRAGQSP